MRIVIAASLGALLGTVSAPVLSEPSQAAAEPASVSSYICKFSGQCGDADAAAVGDEPTKAAPEIKGFRIAKIAPMASGGSAPAMAASAEPTTMKVAHVRPVTRLASLSAPRSMPALASTSAPTPVAAGTRADLMLSFEYNSDKMTPEALEKAKVFAAALMAPELKDKHFLIEGHTDSRGSRDLNLDLSRRRAQSVADYLVSQGVEQGRVEVKGVGPDEPLPGQPAGASANRRVEAVLLS